MDIIAGFVQPRSNHKNTLFKDDRRHGTFLVYKLPHCPWSYLFTLISLPSRMVKTRLSSRLTIT